MKVKVEIHREIEVEVDSPALDELYNYRNDPQHLVPDDVVIAATEAVEKAANLPFGGHASEIIVAVHSMDDEALLEW